MMRVETIGNAVLYLGDCREVLPTLGAVDAVVSDPPYGQKLKTNVIAGGDAEAVKSGAVGERYAVAKARTGGLKNPIKNGTIWPATIKGDDKPFEPELILKAAKKTLLWGAHKFGDKLPRGRWLAWDKVPTGKIRDQGDGELAWTNVDPDALLRIHRLLWDGVCVGSAARHEVTSGTPRAHPTQKPESLMAWCLQFLKLQPNSLICDPYMGAGSTGIAALKAGHRFIGIELEPLYFETACRRIEDAQRQGSLFGEQAA